MIHVVAKRVHPLLQNGIVNLPLQCIGAEDRTILVHARGSWWWLRGGGGGGGGGDEINPISVCFPSSTVIDILKT